MTVMASARHSLLHNTAASAGCPLAHRAHVTSYARCMRYSSWSRVHSYRPICFSSARCWILKKIRMARKSYIRSGDGPILYQWRSVRDVAKCFECALANTRHNWTFVWRIHLARPDWRHHCAVLSVRSSMFALMHFQPQTQRRGSTD